MVTEAPIADCFGNVIFCDDVRYEVGSKVSYMGTYRGLIRIQGVAPVALPKFVFVVRFWQKRGEYVPGLPIWIFLPGDDFNKPSIIAQLPSEPLEQVPENKALENLGDPIPYIQTEAHFAFGPLVIPTNGILKVRALYRDQLVRLGTLRVEIVTPQAGDLVTDPQSAPNL